MRCYQRHFTHKTPLDRIKEASERVRRIQEHSIISLLETWGLKSDEDE